MSKLSKRAIPTIIITLLTLSLVLTAIPITPMASANAGIYLTVSQTYIGKNNTIEIRIDDYENNEVIEAHNGTDIVGVYVDTNLYDLKLAKWGASWIAYIANVTAAPTIANVSSLVADETSWGTTVWNQTRIPAKPPTPVTIYNNTENFIWPFVHNITIPSTVKTITVRYYLRGETATLAHGETYVSFDSVDRTTIPPAFKMYMNVSDPTENLDPTAVDYNVYNVSLTRNGEDYITKLKLNASETGANTGTFTLTLEDANHVVTLNKTGDATADWNATYVHSGSYSAKLSVSPGPNTSSVKVYFGKPLADIPTKSITGGTWKVVDEAKFKYWAYATGDTPPHPWVTLELDTDGDGVIDLLLGETGAQQMIGDYNRWVECTPYGDEDGKAAPVPIPSGGGGGWFGYNPITSKFLAYDGTDVTWVETLEPDAVWQPIGWWIDYLPGSTVDYVSIATGWSYDGDLYVDDITINSVVYYMEPAFESERTTKHGDALELTVYDDDKTTKYFTKSFAAQAADGVVSVSPAFVTYADMIEVIVDDFDRNYDILAKESFDIPVMVNATKPKSDTGTLTLTETGKNTGIFHGYVEVDIDASSSLTDSSELVSALKAHVLTACVKPGDTADFNITYADPVFVYYGISEATFSLETTPATVSLDKSSYLLGELATITITEPDLNDNPAKIESFTVDFPPVDGKYNASAVKDSGITRDSAVVGNFTIWVNKVFANVTVPSLTFVETAADSGAFRTVINLVSIHKATNKDLETGDKLTFKYGDKFDDVIDKATVTLGGLVGAVSLDRTVYPIAPSNNVTVHVTLTDSDENANPYVIDKAEVKVKFYNATDQNVTDPIEVELTETGTDTGVFTGKLKYNISDSLYVDGIPENQTGWKANEMVNGKIFINYTEPLAELGWVSTEAMLKARTASIAANVTSANMGEAILVTLTEPDMNLDSKSNQTLQVGFAVDSASKDTITLKETGVNTGVFTAELVIGKETLAGVDPGDTITFNYTDTATGASYYGTEIVENTIETEVSVLSHTATLRFDKAEYGPYAVVTITLYDPDLTLEETATTLDLIKTSIDDRSDVELTAEEYDTELYNGTFTVEIQLNDTGIAVDSAPIDDLYAYYVDDVNAAGDPQTIIAHATIRSTTGTVSLDKSAYLIDEWMNVTVTDADRNEDPDVAEFVEVKVYSDSWPMGTTVNLPETGTDTGLFSAQVQLVDEIPVGNQIMVALGDTITVNYTDPYDATGEKLKIAATAIVGEAPPELPAETSDEETLDSTGAPKTIFVLGETVLASAEVANVGIESQPMLIVVQLKDPQGTVLAPTFIIVTLLPGQSFVYAPGFTLPLTGYMVGTWTAKVMVLDTWPAQGGVAIGLPVTITFTVS